jgi:hypothetical protein
MDFDIHRGVQVETSSGCGVESNVIWTEATESPRDLRLCNKMPVSGVRCKCFKGADTNKQVSSSRPSGVNQANHMVREQRIIYWTGSLDIFPPIISFFPKIPCMVGRGQKRSIEHQEEDESTRGETDDSVGSKLGQRTTATHPTVPYTHVRRHCG